MNWKQEPKSRPRPELEGNTQARGQQVPGSHGRGLRGPQLSEAALPGRTQWRRRPLAGTSVLQEGWGVCAQTAEGGASTRQLRLGRVHAGEVRVRTAGALTAQTTHFQEADMGCVVRGWDKQPPAEDCSQPTTPNPQADSGGRGTAARSGILCN